MAVPVCNIDWMAQHSIKDVRPQPVKNQEQKLPKKISKTAGVNFKQVN